MDIERDTDGEGLTDYNEWAYGTDINCVDSDNDGLSDYEEVAVLGTNPHNHDTDGDGILDGDEDTDDDGLTNIEECQYGTSNCTKDSDGDKIADYDEINIYLTNPLEMDTDGDGANDKWEIDKGYDANVADNGFCITEKEQGINTSVEIKISASGASASSFKINLHKDDGVFISSLLPGYIGSAYDFEIVGEFESATLKYYFDESNLELVDFDPMVYYYNEKTHELEEITTNWDGESNYVTVQLAHFSTYLLLNKTEFEEVWEKEIKAPSVEGSVETNLNIAFVVDLSGSMSGTKLSTTKTAIKSFIDILGENDLASLISFTSDANTRCSLTNDKNLLKTYVDSMSAHGLTAIYTGIEEALNILIQNPVSGYDMIIVFTDGYDEPSTTYEEYYEELVQEAVDNDITIHTIGIQTVDEELLKTISQATEGNYYYASVVSELQDKIDSIKKETVDYTTDSNDDGISDYYTKLICNGTLRVSTGNVIPELICNYDEFQTDADYDKDGLLNGEEIQVIEKNGKIYLEVLSYPTEEDSDGDGILDSDETTRGTKPLVFDASAMDVDYLFNNNIYVASLFSEDYLDDWGLRTQLGLGNLVTNFKVSYVNDYKQALLQFIELYNTSVYEEAKLNMLKDLYQSNLNEFMLELVNYGLILDDVSYELSGYAQAVETLNKSTTAIKSLESTLKAIDNYADIVGFDDELIQTYANIQVQLLEQQSTNEAALKALGKSKLEGKLAEKVGRYINNMPSKVITAMKVVKAFSDVVTYGTIIIDTGIDVSDTLDLYASLNVGLIQYVELDEFLESIILYSENSDLKLAAKDVRLALSNDFARSVSEGLMITQNIGEGVATTVYTYALTHTGPLGWAIYLGWGLGNLISNTNTIDEELLKVIAYGDSAVSYGKYLKWRLNYDTPYYYECDESLLNEFQILGQLRIVGEDKYAEVANERSFVRKWIEGFFGGSQKELEESCLDTIDQVVRKCNNFKVLVYKNFMNSYLSQ